MTNTELAAMVSSSAGTSAAVLGFLILHRSKFKNWGWLFPVAVALEIAALINLSHAYSLDPRVEPWIDPAFTGPVEKSLVDSFLVMGFGFAFYRLLRRQLNNSIFKWTFIMAFSVMLMSAILTHIHVAAPTLYQWFSVWVTLSLTFAFGTLATFASRTMLPYLTGFLFTYGVGTSFSCVSQFLAATGGANALSWSALTHGLSQVIQCVAYLWLFAFTYTRHVTEITMALDRLAADPEGEFFDFR